MVVSFCAYIVKGLSLTNKSCIKQVIIRFNRIVKLLIMPQLRMRF